MVDSNDPIPTEFLPRKLRNSGFTEAHARPMTESELATRNTEARGLADMPRQLAVALDHELSPFVPKRGGSDVPADEAVISKRSSLHNAAVELYDLRFHELMEVCTRAVAKNEALKGVNPYELAVGLSGFAVEELK